MGMVNHNHRITIVPDKVEGQMHLEKADRDMTRVLRYIDFQDVIRFGAIADHVNWISLAIDPVVEKLSKRGISSSFQVALQVGGVGKPVGEGGIVEVGIQATEKGLIAHLPAQHVQHDGTLAVGEP